MVITRYIQNLKTTVTKCFTEQSLKWQQEKLNGKKQGAACCQFCELLWRLIQRNPTLVYIEMEFFFFYSIAKHFRNVLRCSENLTEGWLAASCPAWSHTPPHHRAAETELTLSPLNSFCLVVGVPERRQGLEALRAGLRPDWRRPQQGPGQMMAKRRWPLTFSVGLRPEGRV